MVLKTLMKSIRQYKRQSIASPVFVSIEVIMECILPLIMAKVIDSMNGNSMGPILKYGLILVIFRNDFPVLWDNGRKRGGNCILRFCEESETGYVF